MEVRGNRHCSGAVASKIKPGAWVSSLQEYWVGETTSETTRPQAPPERTAGQEVGGVMPEFLLVGPGCLECGGQGWTIADATEEQHKDASAHGCIAIGKAVPCRGCCSQEVD